VYQNVRRSLKRPQNITSKVAIFWEKMSKKFQVQKINKGKIGIKFSQNLHHQNVPHCLNGAENLTSHSKKLKKRKFSKSFILARL
jgi:hypothetical protein